MLEQTARLNHTIQDLSLLAKTETLNASALSAPFSLPELVDEILVLLDVLLEDRHIRIRQEGAATVVEPVLADRGLIRIALMNVLHNAIRFSREDSTIGITYWHETRDGRAQLRVCIQDNGSGIAAGEHARIFERFFTSASPSTTMQSGAGWGFRSRS
jgi:signal transduction histidine kinase